MAYKEQKCIAHNSGAWKSEIRTAAWWDLVRALFLTCRWLPPGYVLTWRRERERERERDLSLLIRTPILSDQPPTLIPSLNLNYLHKDLIFKYSQIKGLEASTYEFWGNTSIQSITTSNTSSFTKMSNSALTRSCTSQSDTSTHPHALICHMASSTLPSRKHDGGHLSKETADEGLTSSYTPDFWPPAPLDLWSLGLPHTRLQADIWPLSPVRMLGFDLLVPVGPQHPQPCCLCHLPASQPPVVSLRWLVYMSFPAVSLPRAATPPPPVTPATGVPVESIYTVSPRGWGTSCFPGWWGGQSLHQLYK